MDIGKKRRENAADLNPISRSAKLYLEPNWDSSARFTHDELV